MPPIKHALLGPSSAERWLNCPPSARLTEDMEDKGSEYAAAGSLAHEIAELKARSYFLEPMSKRTLSSRLNKLKKSEHYAPDMDAATDEYLEALKSLALTRESAPFVALEIQLDLSDIVPECFGTADCIMIGEGILDVVDYKNGSGVAVSAVRNPQMMLYAYGAIQMFSPIYGDSIKLVRMTIVQPHAGGVKSDEMPVQELLGWAHDYVKERAQLAWAGQGDYADGDWCRFCKAKATCAQRAKAMFDVEPMLGGEPEEALTEEKIRMREYADGCGADVPPLLTDTQIGDILTRGKNVAAWLKDLEAYALNASLMGATIPGWKAVEGRGSRDWIEGTDKAFDTLVERGVPEAMLYERKPLSVAALEKSMGKKEFEGIAKDLWAKSPGKPTLVPESDKRPAYNSAETAFVAVDPDMTDR